MVLLIRHQTMILTSQESGLCKSSAEELLSIIQEISFYSVELPASRQFHLDRLSQTLKEGLELSQKVLNLGRWKIYKNLMLSRKMEKLAKKVSMFSNGPLHAHVLVDVHHMRGPYLLLAAANENLVKQVVPRGADHECNLLDRMAISIKYLPEKASWIWDPFLKTRRFPLRWLSICDIDEEEVDGLVPDGIPQGPTAQVLILNFSSEEFFLPPFIVRLDQPDVPLSSGADN
ncbi:hypothetical protein EZV62_021506 [Acer yangbiense]|uniref:RPW8 domain-containing protein n=1 Tax=Acer yangbiense TaxID=1000413 RepID=A0A5C7H5V3_9ROSI|nr:hypothetical protein EZV62_021506 [Acer yangbiense]